MSNDIYSIPQQIILVLCSAISGSFSLLGSSIIFWIIWRDRSIKLKHVYHRILLVISIIDCVISINFIFSFLAVKGEIQALVKPADSSVHSSLPSVFTILAWRCIIISLSCDQYLKIPWLGRLSHSLISYRFYSPSHFVLGY